MGKWLLVFIATPLVEMYILIEVGGIIGAWPTIGLVVLTAVIGVGLIRAQGFATLTRGIARLNAGEMPATEMVEGVMLALAGALMVTPGFVTDAVGFVLLTPPLRRRLAMELLRRLAAAGQVDSGEGGRTIEGRFRRH
ncbi:MAG: FxsA family protein [Gammaproteobacteria bacterium]|nr:FxsA family protein [Gammaproteobacteria bacterium]MDE0226084.1 FxsA family protein [Gammaproteobacteria bacterium]MDE0450622.1 FxsA family protein [Gammaproteobacteria bacterium]